MSKLQNMVHVFWETNYFKVYLSLKVNIWGTGCAEAIHFSLTLRSTLTKVLVFRELCPPNPPNIKDLAATILVYHTG